MKKKVSQAVRIAAAVLLVQTILLTKLHADPMSDSDSSPGLFQATVSRTIIADQEVQSEEFSSIGFVETSVEVFPNEESSACGCEELVYADRLADPQEDLNEFRICINDFWHSESSLENIAE